MTPRAGSFLSQTEWFFDLYAQVMLERDKNMGAALAARVKAANAGCDTVEIGLALGLLATYAVKTGDVALVHSAEVKKGCDLLLERLEHVNSPAATEHCKTWELAVSTSALRNINLFTKRSEIARLVGGIKNHVYANNILKNKLMSSSDLRTIGYDILFTCVPMGLFEPEDLVLVEAIKELCEPERLHNARPEENLLLAWYFTEQGSYAKARDLVHKTTNSGPLEAIVRQRLEALGQLDNRFISHRPQGNGNRYEPLIEERFPKLVAAGDKVIVRAQSSPFDSDDPLELVIGGKITMGVKLKDCWEFKIPAMEAGEHCNYHLQFENSPHAPTGKYRFEVLRKVELLSARGVTPTKNGAIIHGENCRIVVTIDDAGQVEIEINPGPHDGVAPSCTENHHRLEFADFTLDVELKPFTLRLSRSDQKLFATCKAGLSWLEASDGNVHRIDLSLKAEPCGIYGLGERFNALNQCGNRLDQFVYNQYKNQGLRTYLPMPVFYTDAGWGMHLNSFSYSEFDFFSTGDNRISLSVEAGSMSLQVLAGSIKRQIAQFVERTGKPEMVPHWALGPWMSSNNWDSEAEIRRQVTLNKKHKIPATVLVVEAWSDEATFYIFNDATYEENDGETALTFSDFDFPDRGRWPDPKGLIAFLHDNDLACLLWQIPIIKQVSSLTHLQKHNDEKAFINNEYGVKNADGTPFRLPEGWFKDSLLLDFTNLEAKKWWFEKRQYLLDDIGIDGFKTDGGEFIFGHDLVFADGSSGLTMRNKYPNDYVASYYDFARQNNGITFSRAGFTGAQSFPAHWAGDERSTWDAFRRSMLAGLSAGMSGIIFWGWDLAGFSGPIPGAELYIRSTQMACFCPIMQYHAESKAEHNQDRTPWNIATRTGDPRALDIYRFYANLRMSLMPYLIGEAEHCVSTGTPLMRAMILDYQQDPAAGELWDQYFFGRDLLVAPIVHEGETSRSVYLPQGNWWHLFENTWFASGKHVVEAGLETIPVFVRAGAVIPLAFDKDATLGAAMPSDINAPQQIIFLIANLGSGRYDFSTNADTLISVEWNDQGEVTITAPDRMDKQYALLFAVRPGEARINGQKVVIGELCVSGTPLSSISL